MSILASDQVLRPAPGGLKGRLRSLALTAAPVALGVLRWLKPILRLGSFYVVTRYDDVREVFLSSHALDTPYKPNIDVLTGGEPFFLGMRDTAQYHADVAAMREVFLPGDLPLLGDEAERLAGEAVEAAEAAGNRLEIVGDLVRNVTFSLYSRYMGIPEPEEGHLAVWSTRLFEFQFAGSPNDTDLRRQVDEIAPAFRDHIDRQIALRKQDGTQRDDVLGRCLTRQEQGDGQFTDLFIRTNMLCMIVGGPPQLPMVAPQAMEQLLRRPDALRLARRAAETSDDGVLWQVVREAMRFDPLAPGVPRVAFDDVILARGTARETEVPEGATVFAAFSSAMMDSRRIRDPGSFDHTRLDHEYIHFGHGLHECFGRFLNAATLHRILKPVLKRPNLRRASGSDGHLSKNGIFAERLVVDFD